MCSSTLHIMKVFDRDIHAHHIPFIVAAMVLLIVVTGGWVRISDAGESCPDWPTCFGELGFNISSEKQMEWWGENPDEADSRHENDPTFTYTTSQIFTEWLHRFLVGIVGIILLYSQIIVWNKREEIGNRPYKIHAGALLLLISQAIVGMITVRYDNAPWSVSVHLAAAMLFITTLLWSGIVWMKCEKVLPKNFKIETKETIWKLLLIMSIVALVMGMVGGYISSGKYADDCSTVIVNGWPLFNGEVIPAHENFGANVTFLHRILALMTGGVLFWGGQWMRENDGKNILTTHVDIALGLFVMNLIVGALHLVMIDEDGFPGWLSLMHLTLATLMFIALAFATVIAHEALKE